MGNTDSVSNPEIPEPDKEKVSILDTLTVEDADDLPLCDEGRANVRYYEKRRWLNYMSGVAMIISSDGSVNYIPVRSLEKGTMQ